MSIIKELEDIKQIIHKNKKSPIIIVGIVILTWMGLLNIPLQFKWKGISLDIILAIVLSIIELLIWFLWIVHIPKNKTNKQGIAFLICSNEIEKKDIEKENFFKALKNECYELFHILIYEINDLKKYKKNYTLDEIMKDLNLTILFEVKERNGNINNDNNYEIEILNTNIYFTHSISVELIPTFAQDVTKSINKHLQISHSNSFIDNKNEISMLELSTLYIISIIQIVSLEPEKSFQMLDKISAILNVTKLKKSEYAYIEKNLPYRYLEAYQNTILKLLDTKKYYENPEHLRYIKNLQDTLYKKLNDYKDAGKIQKSVYKVFYQNYILQRAIILYEESGAEKALEIINKYDYTVQYNHGAYFSKAFLLMMSGKVEESIKYYMKVLKRKDLDQNQVEEILDFINVRQSINPDNLYIKLCYAIINYFRKDIKLANNMFDEIKKRNPTMIKIIDDIVTSKNVG